MNCTIQLEAHGAPSEKLSCADSQQASMLWENYRDAYGLGASDMKRNCGKVRTENGKVICSISYNGRVWLPDGRPVEVLFGGLKILSFRTEKSEAE